MLQTKYGFAFPIHIWPKSLLINPQKSAFFPFSDGHSTRFLPLSFNLPTRKKMFFLLPRFLKFVALLPNKMRTLHFYTVRKKKRTRKRGIILLFSVASSFLSYSLFFPSLSLTLSSFFLSPLFGARINRAGEKGWREKKRGESEIAVRSHHILHVLPSTKKRK